MTLVGLCQQCLVDITAVHLEPILRPGHVQPPDAVGHIISETMCFVSVFFQPVYPMSQCQRVMLAQALHVAYRKAPLLDRSQCTADGYKFSIWKDILRSEAWSAFWKGGVAGNSMVEEDAARTEQMPGLLKVRRQQCFTHMLKHANTDNFVKSICIIDFPIITHLHATASR